MAEHNRPCQQKDLVEIIQSVHTSLRKKAETVRPDDVWEEHCKDVSTLSKYREAMKKLATEHWEQSVANERITWSVDTVREYFRDGGLQRALDKDERRRKYEEQQKDERAIRPRQTAIPRHLYSRQLSDHDGAVQKLSLLDVGSCFNPFSVFREELNVTPIDINPADDSVLRGDILSLEVSIPLADASMLDPQSIPTPVLSLPGRYFDIVVFSLLLSYLPSTSQRWTSCFKAHELLKVNGLLLVITPDSKHQNRNAPMMKRWKTAIESIGFTRWRYTKHDHDHCMAFRKLVTPDGHKSLREGPQMLTIPQEFNASEQSEHGGPVKKKRVA